MDEPVKNSIWNYLIPLHYLEQVSSILERRGVEVSLTSHLQGILEISTNNAVAHKKYTMYNYFSPFMP